MAFTRLEPTGINTAATFTYANVVTVDLAATGNVNLGAVTNLTITGGQADYYLKTDGSGSLSWAAVAGGGGSSSSISNGTSNVSVDTTNGNVTASIGGVSDVLVVSSAGAEVNGNISATYYIGNGSQLTGIVTSTYSNTNVAAYLPTYAGQMANALVTGTVYTNAQPNITSVGTLTSLTSGLITATSGGIRVGNIKDPSGTNTISLASGNVSMSGNLSVATGNITASYFIGNGSQLTGLPATYSNTNTAAYLPTHTGNVGAAYFVGNGAFLTGLSSSSYSNATAAAYLPTHTGLVGGTLSTAAQPNITSVGTLSSLTVTGLAQSGNVRTTNILDNSGTITVQTKYSGVAGDIGIVGSITAGTGGTGNVTATYFIGNGSQLTGLPATYSNTNTAAYLPTHTGNVGAAYFVGNGAFLTGLSSSSYSNATAAAYLPTHTGNVGGTMSTAAQPYVTSLGSLTGLTVTGTIVMQQTQEAFQAKTGATGAVTHDYSTGATFYHTSVAGNFTAAVTNLPSTAGRISLLALIIIQGATPYVCNAITINGGTSLTINWLGNSIPTGTANKKECMVFTIINNGGTYTVFGQIATYG